MRLVLRVLGYEVLSVGLEDGTESEEWITTSGQIEAAATDDGTAYAPGFSEDDCWETEDFKVGFAGAS